MAANVEQGDLFLRDLQRESDAIVVRYHHDGANTPGGPCTMPGVAAHPLANFGQHPLELTRQPRDVDLTNIEHNFLVQVEVLN